MITCLEKEDCTIQIRDKLRKEGVKLWLPPYLKNSNESSEDDIMVNIQNMAIFILFIFTILS